MKSGETTSIDTQRGPDEDDLLASRGKALNVFLRERRWEKRDPSPYVFSGKWEKCYGKDVVPQERE